MSVLPASWPSQHAPWYGHSGASFSALAAPVIPPLSPLDPFPSPTHGHSDFSSALAAPSPPRRSTPHPRHQSSPNAAPGPSALGGVSNVPPRNMRALDRDGLVQVLNFLSTLLASRFPNGHQIRLVIHGGAVMLLNEELAKLAALTAATDSRAKQRSTTRDIDYIARSFSSEWSARYGVHDANDRLRQCTLETALQFGLGADWMNSDADVALPMATDPISGTVYDPIHAASLQTGDTLSVYTSPNGLLKLVSVTPFWAVALKMVRYNAADREDICILLRSGTQARQLHWTPARLEIWLLGMCWAMNYAGYDPERIKEMRRRMIEVVDEVNRWDPNAVADDGRGGVVPLRQSSWPGYPYNQPPLYSFPGGDPRGSSPFISPGHSPRANTFPPAGMLSTTTPFAPPPPISPAKKKKKKKSKSKTLAPAATWSNRWTAPADSFVVEQQQWDPNQREQWDEGVWKTAAKDKKQGRLTSWIPWLKSAKSQPALRASAVKHRRRSNEDTESESESDLDSSDDDDDWLERERAKWGKTGRDSDSVQADHGHGHGGGFVPPGIQHSVASFMSNGMTPITAPAVLASGPTAAAEQRVLPGWNLPGASMSPPPPPLPPPGWTYPGASMSPPPPWSARMQSPPPWYTGGNHTQRIHSPPMGHVHSHVYPYSQPHVYPYPYPYQQHQQQAAAGMNQVSSGMNALGLFGV
ncbi:hypothetical protein FB45DRAFT_901080 [Roridomyces roridus]|uniref:Uncharacterized protein n=1 Tax=Roridomyces roridus TaxID=1738132 RepID=A0AAD7CAC7_9AGAR|nr:hypothetical protein FB45DRAFT_901080 [Roridomyces roridus]